MQICIQGSQPLKGEVAVSTSKNAVLPILMAAILASDPVEIRQIPQIADVRVVLQLLQNIGCQVKLQASNVQISGEIHELCPSSELVRHIRGSFLMMGALLAKKHRVRISLPGGCAIGSRPVDLHLKGLRLLGAEIRFVGGDIIASAPKLYGNHIYLDFPSVGATENIMMAAALAEGTTFIENAALEPEIVDLAAFINTMGGKITGAGSSLLRIEGVPRLHGSVYTPIPDRIEAGSLLLAIAATEGEGRVNHLIPAHLKAITAKLRESGAEIEEGTDSIAVRGTATLQPIYVKTLPYPGFPTDMQAQIMAYLCRCASSSIISETIFENRFLHVPELRRMGADIRLEGRTAVIRGHRSLSGAQVRATDLRAGAALMIAGLMAEGNTWIDDCEHIDRGYERLPEKLQSLGAKLTMTS